MERLMPLIPQEVSYTTVVSCISVSMQAYIVLIMHRYYSDNIYLAVIIDSTPVLLIRQHHQFYVTVLSMFQVNLVGQADAP